MYISEVDEATVERAQTKIRGLAPKWYQEHEADLQPLFQYALGGEGDPAVLALNLGCLIPHPSEMDRGWVDAQNYLMALINHEKVLRDPRSPSELESEGALNILSPSWLEAVLEDD